LLNPTQLGVQERKQLVVSMQDVYSIEGSECRCAAVVRR
jgi:hypothetical protein